MKISLNWIKEYTDVKLPVDQLVDKIGAQLGAVEEVIDFGKKYQGIVISKVVSCQNHPNADKLKLCLIDDGRKAKNVKRDAKGLVQVVCGAPNVREGMLVAWLPPGATIPVTFEKEPLVLEKKEIRGEISNGMLASSHELDLSDDHSGILDIDPESTRIKKVEGEVPHNKVFESYASIANVKVGADFAETFGLNDYVIDVENKMFTHRPDCFGILGVAREIAGIQHRAFTSPNWYITPKTSGTQADKNLLNVKNELSKLVPRFMAQVVEGVNIKPSSLRIQSQMARVGLKPINNVVDITNYVMYLTGQPLHAYDYDKVKTLSGKTPTLLVRQSKKGETLKLLNGKTIAFDQPAVVIATDKQAIGVGGVMGGADTEVDENTKNIIIECANFDMYDIRKTAMHYGLFTDAVTRFTKGQSPLQNDRVIYWAVSNIVHETAGLPARSIYDIKSRLTQPARVTVNAAFVNERLGTKLSIKEMAKLLENVEFKLFNPPAGRSQLYVEPPFWRTDIHIPEDVVEEIGRLYGYDHLPLVLPKRVIKPATLNPMFDLKAKARDILSDAGANEVLTYAFVHADMLKKAGQDPKDCYQISNALSPELQYYRPSLIPSLLDKIHSNIKAGYGEFGLFEINPVHAKSLIGKEDGLPIEDQRLAFVFAADEKTAKANYQGAPYFQAKHYLEQLLTSLGINPVYEPATGHKPELGISKAAIAPFETSRASIVKTKEGEFVGELGEFKLSVRKSFKLPDFVAGFEIDVAQLMKLQTGNNYHALPRYPKVQQDISLKINSNLDYQSLSNFVWEQVAELQPEDCWWSLNPIDIYQKGKSKHITLRLEIASYSRTLTDEFVNELLDKAANAAKVKFGAERL